MALNDVLSDLQADKKEKKTADKKYVSFLKEEWAEMEKGLAQRVTALNRYGRAEGAASRHGWESAGAGDIYARWTNPDQRRWFRTT